MKDNLQIMAEINDLLQQQAEALKRHLDALEAAEYAHRAKRIHELFGLLEHKTETCDGLPDLSS